MKKKIEEIKSFKELYEYIGSDITKDKTDMELIVEAYEKAKNKGYINNQRYRNNDNNFRRGGSAERRNNFWRGRDREFRGGRGRRIERGRGFNRGRGRGHSFRGRGFNRGRNYRSRSRSGSR